MTTPIRNLSDDIFLGQYCRPLDGRRLSLPSEWARVFRDGGGVVAVQHPNENLVLTTKEKAVAAPDVELSRCVPCRMDERGRVAIPEAFRMLFDGGKSVTMTGMVHYVEVRRE